MTAGETPFSYRIDVGRLAAKPLELHLNASEDERKALARLWSVESVESLVGDVEVARWKRDGVRIKGRVEAALTQACVVTLDPVESVINEPFDARFVPEGSRLADLRPEEDGEVVVDAEGPDAPEPFAGDTIDVAAVIAEFAALSIDPYPRAASAEFPPHVESGESPEDDESPFAALKDWPRTP